MRIEGRGRSYTNSVGQERQAAPRKSSIGDRQYLKQTLPLKASSHRRQRNHYPPRKEDPMLVRPMRRVLITFTASMAITLGLSPVNAQRKPRPAHQEPAKPPAS